MDLVSYINWIIIIIAWVIGFLILFYYSRKKNSGNKQKKIEEGTETESDDNKEIIEGDKVYKVCSVSKKQRGGFISFLSKLIFRDPERLISTIKSMSITQKVFCGLFLLFVIPIVAITLWLCYGITIKTMLLLLS